MTHAPLIVFTDLDGTLLDHDNYSYAPALPALNLLKSLNIPVVLASSKTAAEIAPLRAELGLDHIPAIVENGAGLLPAGQASLTGEGDYARILAALAALPADLRQQYRGFADMGPEGITDATGLPTPQAALAGTRQFSEPGLWLGDPDLRPQFLAELAKRGITGRDGGRFLTLSCGGTKADRMAQIAEQFNAPASVALGDAPNDVEMLETATHGVIIANPHRPDLPALKGEATGHIRRSTHPGPTGWNAAIHDILNELGLSPERSPRG